ncbi:MAG: RNA pseudouridine synthase [Imperialibacter sp.]|uniref:RluA family pseudouridine synthase n=1 Tax=Imperialibacter sp. TaxID=2038411 RepID=UPI0032EEBF56
MKKEKFEDWILFENENYLLINKPPFLSTLMDRQSERNILDLARGYVADAQVAHRLDKNTSGVIAIAKNPEAYRSLAIQFEKRKVYKIYHALTDGIHKFEDHKVAVPLLTTGKGEVKPSRKGKASETILNSVKAFSNHTLLSCKPLTGRMHQVRVHCAYAGAPIAGDELYGGKWLYLSSLKRKFNIGKFEEEQPLIKRYALHAHELAFKDLDGKKVGAVAPYPKDFEVLIKQLEKNS